MSLRNVVAGLFRATSDCRYGRASPRYRGRQRPTRYGLVPNILRSQSAARFQPCGRDAALVLVQLRGENLPRHSRARIRAARSQTGGIAAILMSNPLAGPGASPKDAEQAQAAIEQGRRIGAKTQRERDYIEAVAAYYAGLGRTAPSVRASSHGRRRSRRSPHAIRTTTRRRSSPRSILPAPSRRPIRLTPRT